MLRRNDEADLVPPALQNVYVLAVSDGHTRLLIDGRLAGIRHDLTPTHHRLDLAVRGRRVRADVKFLALDHDRDGLTDEVIAALESATILNGLFDDGCPLADAEVPAEVAALRMVFFGALALDGHRAA
jgi:hypothetical protein